jgi:hypothetical protein
MAIHVAEIVAVLKGKPAETNRQGNQVHRHFWSTERYVVDFAPDYRDAGWQQFDTDQDAWYFGVWVNPKSFLVLTYCEGDWSLDVCENVAQYNKQIQALIDFYGEGFECITLNPDTGERTIYRQDRSKFLLPE